MAAYYVILSPVEKHPKGIKLTHQRSLSFRFYTVIRKVMEEIFRDRSCFF